MKFLTLCAGLLPLLAAATDPAALYASHCAQCHGADRLGAMGPALFPENLERLRKNDALERTL